MMNANGSLGNNISIPLDALEAVEMQDRSRFRSTGRTAAVNPDGDAQRRHAFTIRVSFPSERDLQRK